MEINNVELFLLKTLKELLKDENGDVVSVGKIRLYCEIWDILDNTNNKFNDDISVKIHIKNTLKKLINVLIEDFSTMSKKNDKLCLQITQTLILKLNVILEREEDE